MYFCCAIAGSVARRTAMRVLLNNSAPRRLVPAYFANFEQFQRGLQRGMSSTAASKGGEWSKEDLEAKPEEPEQEIHPLDAEKWTTVYKFKYVKVLRIIVRLKIYQSVVGLATFVALPINQYFGWPLSDEALMMIGGANVYGLAMTVMAGYLAQQVAGILYINESKDKVRVATLSFVGHRVDLMYEIEDIIPAADMGNRSLGKVPQVILKSFSKPNETSLILLGPFGGFLNRELFEEVFGTVPQLPPKRVTRFGRKDDT